MRLLRWIYIFSETKYKNKTEVCERRISGRRNCMRKGEGRQNMVLYDIISSLRLLKQNVRWGWEGGMFTEVDSVQSEDQRREGGKIHIIITFCFFSTYSCKNNIFWESLKIFGLAIHNLQGWSKCLLGQPLSYNQFCWWKNNLKNLRIIPSTCLFSNSFWCSAEKIFTFCYHQNKYGRNRVRKALSQFWFIVGFILSWVIRWIVTFTMCYYWT